MGWPIGPQLLCNHILTQLAMKSASPRWVGVGYPLIGEKKPTRSLLQAAGLLRVGGYEEASHLREGKGTYLGSLPHLIPSYGSSPCLSSYITLTSSPRVPFIVKMVDIVCFSALGLAAFFLVYKIIEPGKRGTVTPPCPLFHAHSAYNSIVDLETPLPTSFLIFLISQYISFTFVITYGLWALFSGLVRLASVVRSSTGLIVQHLCVKPSWLYWSVSLCFFIYWDVRKSPLS